MDVACLIQVAADDRRLPLQLPRNPAQHQALAGIIKHWPLIRPHLFKNTVGKPSEAEYVNVHDPLLRMHHHQILLRLHRKLIRHDDQEIPIRLLLRPRNDFLI